MRINRYHGQVLLLEAVVAAVACLVIFVGFWARTSSQPAQAHAFLEDVTKLEVGTSTFEDARAVAKKHGGIPWWVSDGSMRCTYEKCVFRFVFENKPLSSTHLVPYTGLIGTLIVNDGVLVGRWIDYYRSAARPFSYSV